MNQSLYPLINTTNSFKILIGDWLPWASIAVQDSIMIWLQMVWYFRSRIELVNLSLIKSALLVSIPGFTLSNLKHAKHYFQTTLNSVTLSAVCCTGCVHHNGPFFNEDYSWAAFRWIPEWLQWNATSSSSNPPGDPKRVRISPYQLIINPLTASRYSMAIDWPELALLC